MDKSIKTIVVPYGVYLGLALSLVTVLAYAMNLELFTKWWFAIISFVIVLVIAILAVKNAKRLVPGFMSFKEAFSAYFIPIAIGTFISGIVSFLLFNLVDPTAAQTVMEYTVDMTRSMLENFGAPESEIEKAITEMESDNQFSLLNHLKGYAFSLIFYALIGLVIALIFREKDPNAV